MIRKTLALSWVLALCLVGCASLGIAPADTFNKRVIVAAGLVESSVVTLEILDDAGKISDADGLAFTKRVQDARDSIELARVIYASNPMDANDRLSAAILSLNALKAALEAKQR